MARGRRFVGQVVLVLAMMAAGFAGAKLGMLGTRDAGASHNFSDVPDSAFYHLRTVPRGRRHHLGVQRRATAVLRGASARVPGRPTPRSTGWATSSVGYNEAESDDVRTGSHNLVVGPFHTYSSVGGLVAGVDNAVTGPFASVSGGSSNTASNELSSVSGGFGNTASGDSASVSGGVMNTASGGAASVSGGQSNTASGPTASVSGGANRSAMGTDDWVAGGFSQDN